MCTSCSGHPGIETCDTDQIVVRSGYWRQFSQSTAVIKCPERSGCEMGNATGNALCAAGYSGPLCAVCEDGYYPDVDTCRDCSEHAPSIVATLWIVGLACFVIAVLRSYHYFLHLKVNFRRMTTMKLPQNHEWRTRTWTTTSMA